VDRIRIRLQVSVLLIGQRLGGSIGHLLLVLFEKLRVDGDLGRSKSRGGNEFLSLCQ
jgi:hypothetical protein